MAGHSQSRGRVSFVLLILIAWGSATAWAGAPHRRRARVLAPTSVGIDRATSIYPYEGTFFPTPYMTVRGNSPTGGGYSPLGLYGDSTMVLYGPLSSLRATAAPLVTYSRGYDGRTVIHEGTSFSTPNLPGASTVIYPTRATYYYGFRESGDPPWWSSGINWIDQN